MCLIECVVHVWKFDCDQGLRKRHKPRDIEFNVLIDVDNSFHGLFILEEIVIKSKKYQTSGCLPELSGSTSVTARTAR